MRLVQKSEEVSFAAASIVDEEGVQSCVYHEIFTELTVKQREVFTLLAENRTGKEIAHRLGISESAVIKRIEGVRSRTGYPPRADLARAYARYLAELAEQPQVEDFSHALSQSVSSLSLWQRGAADWILPGALVGANAGLNRLAAMVVIAVGMLFVVLASLGLARALSNLS